MKDVLHELWHSITALGLPVFYILIILLFANVDPAFNWRKAVLIFVLIEGISTIIKFMYPADRPIPAKRTTLFQNYIASSFPSVHSARMSALATIMILTFPNNTFFSLLFVLLTVGVGYSRIYLKKHYPRDVAVGFVLGIVVAYIVGVW